LFIELDPRRLKLLCDVTLAERVSVLSLGETLVLLWLASDGLSASADGSGCAGEAVHWDWDILAVADLLKLDVGDLLVINECGVVKGHETREFGEV